MDMPETWNAIAGVDRVHEPSIDQDGRLRGFKFDTVVGGKAYEGTASPHARVEGETMSWNIGNSQIKGVIDVGLSDSPNGTLLSVAIDIEPIGILSSMFFGVISKTIREGLPRTVNEMAGKLALTD